MTMACAIVVFLKLPESRPEGRSGPGATGGTGGGDSVRLVTVLRDGRFMGVVGLSFLVALIFQQGSVGLPVAMGRAGFTPADYGMAIAVNGVLIVALQIPVTRLIEHRDARRLLIVSSMLAGYGFGLTAFAGSVGVFALTVCVWTLGEMVNAPTQTGLVVRLSPVHGRGRYQGVYSLSWSLAALVAPLMSGAVIDRFGAAWLWGTCAVVGTVAGLGYGALMRRLPQEPRAEGDVTKESVVEKPVVAKSVAAASVVEESVVSVKEGAVVEGARSLPVVAAETAALGAVEGDSRGEAGAGARVG
jgi:MFS family permease